MTRIVALLCFAWAAGAAACPTCVGPRLGDSEHGAGDAVFSSSTTFGIDWLGPNLQRDELREELGLELEVRGPLYTETNQFELAGEMRDNLDHWFVARCAADAPKMKGVTAEELRSASFLKGRMAFGHFATTKP